jgi:hypothetical protein
VGPTSVCEREERYPRRRCCRCKSSTASACQAPAPFTCQKIPPTSARTNLRARTTSLLLCTHQLPHSRRDAEPEPVPSPPLSLLLPPLVPVASWCRRGTAPHDGQHHRGVQPSRQGARALLRGARRAGAPPEAPQCRIHRRRGRLARRPRRTRAPLPATGNPEASSAALLASKKSNPVADGHAQLGFTCFACFLHKSSAPSP